MSELPALAPDVVDALRAGDRRILARLLSTLEDGVTPASALMGQIDGLAPERDVLGITGPPGVGKSTLVAALAAAATADGRRVAILAVDPSSPISGGAVLGDRIRMHGRVAADVFIRSFANRGLVGGLTRVLPYAIELVAAAGHDLVIVETVGVGQSEFDVRRLVDVTVVVLAPELGDEIQATKAGLMEIADVFVVNKSDLPGASRAILNLATGTALRHTIDGRVPVLKASATTGENVEGVWETLRDALSAAAGRPRRNGVRRARLEAMAQAITDIILSADDGSRPGSSIVSRVLEGALDPHDAALEVEELLTREQSR